MTEEGKRLAMKKIGLQLSKLKEVDPNLDFELVKTPTGFLNVLKKEEIPNHSKGEGDRYELKVQPPFGTIRFIVYATRLPMSHVNLKTTAGGIFQYRGSEKSFRNSVKHIIPVGEEQLAELYDAAWEIKTVPHK